MKKEIKLSNSSAKSKLNGMEQQMSALSMMGTGTGTGTNIPSDVIDNPFYNPDGTGTGVGTNDDTKKDLKFKGATTNASCNVDGLTVSYAGTFSFSFSVNKSNPALLNFSGLELSLDEPIVTGGEPTTVGDYEIEKIIHLQNRTVTYESCSGNNVNRTMEIPFEIETIKRAINPLLSDDQDGPVPPYYGVFELTFSVNYSLFDSKDALVGNLSMMLK